MAKKEFVDYEIVYAVASAVFQFGQAVKIWIDSDELEPQTKELLLLIYCSLAEMSIPLKQMYLNLRLERDILYGEEDN